MRIARLRTPFVSLLTVATAVALSGTPAAATPSSSSVSLSTPSLATASLMPLGGSGRWLIDPQGRVITVHGFNVIQKVPPYTPSSFGFDDDDAAFLAANGYTAVRLGVIWKALEPTPGHYDEGYLDQLATTVNVLAAHGVYSLLDFHEDNYNEQFGGQGFPDWAVLDSASSGTDPTKAWDAFWNNEMVNGVGLQQHFAQFWQHVAARFSGNAAVLGYDLMNEPRPGSQSTGCTIGICPLITEVKATYQQAVQAIRTVDATHLLFWENLVGDLSDTPAPTGANLGLSYHTYCPYQPTTDPTQEWWRNNVVCPPAEQTQFNQLGAQGPSADSAELLTEFGSTPDTTELTRVTGEADASLVGWTEWTYHRTGVSDFAATPSLVLDPTKPPTGSNVNTDQLNALTRPYPYAVAGTPGSWTYDPGTRTFQLAYNTTRVDGAGTFATGSVSDIVLPVDYPKSYAVTVHGAAITSAPGATTLTLASCAGVSKVTVSVAPTGQTTQDCG